MDHYGVEIRQSESIRQCIVTEYGAIIMYIAEGVPSEESSRDLSGLRKHIRHNPNFVENNFIINENEAVRD